MVNGIGSYLGGEFSDWVAQAESPDHGGQESGDCYHAGATGSEGKVVRAPGVGLWPKCSKFIGQTIGKT